MRTRVIAPSRKVAIGVFVAVVVVGDADIEAAFWKVLQREQARSDGADRSAERRYRRIKPIIGAPGRAGNSRRCELDTQAERSRSSACNAALERRAVGKYAAQRQRIA